MRLTRTFNAGHDNLYLNKDDVNRLLKGQMLKESSLIVQMENHEREWVGLTDEDMNNALDYWSDKSRSAYGGAHAANGEYVDMIETWRYIETKLKERNT